MNRSAHHPNSPYLRPGKLLVFSLALAIGAGNLLAQRSRITAPINDSQRVTLTGHVHPRALPEYDRGRVTPSMELPRVTLSLRQSANQQTELDALLEQQQDPASPEYHHWLTPEEYADRFGASQADIDKISSWLQSQGLTVVGVGRGRTWIAFSGTAGNIGAAFRTQIHNYDVNGRMHFANSTEPSVPAALDGVIRAIHGLTDFRMKPLHTVVSRSSAAQPNYTTGSDHHYLAPGDVATIYNIAPLHQAGITGKGEKVAVVGQTSIDISDIQKFRSSYALPASSPQLVLVPGSRTPAKSSDELVEADLDPELSGAVAPNATIYYVYSEDVMESAQYAIDDKVAPVISMSYGFCEAAAERSDANVLESMARQANAEGITWFAASGDDGVADCAGETGSGFSQSAVSVDLPASLPEVT